MNRDEIEKPHQEYYTKTRWNNWIDKVKKSDFEFKDDKEYDKESKKYEIFINIEDDVIISCLKVASEFKKGVFSSKESLDKLLEIQDIIFEEIEPISEDIDIMLESLKTSFESIFAACECYLQGTYEKDADLKKLLKSAIDAEDKKDFETSLHKIAEMGANVINGGTLPKNISNNLNYGNVIEWLEGIESMKISVKKM